jgi:hypothetical protein
MNPSPAAGRPGASVLSRVLAAVFGGYLLASAAVVLLSHLLPTSVPEAVLGATLFGFAIHVAAVIGVFAAASARRAWGALLASTALMAGLAALFQLFGAQP